MKIKFNSDDNLPLKKTLKLHNSKIVIKSVFEEDVNFILKFIQTSVYMSYERQNKIEDISEGIDINKTNALKQYKICHYWYFKDIGFKYEP